MFLAGVGIEVIAFIRQQVDPSVAVGRSQYLKNTFSVSTKHCAAENCKIIFSLLSDELIDKTGISITQYLLALQLKYNIYSCKYSSQLVAGFSILLL